MIETAHRTTLLEPKLSCRPDDQLQVIYGRAHHGGGGDVVVLQGRQVGGGGGVRQVDGRRHPVVGAAHPVALVDGTPAHRLHVRHPFKTQRDSILSSPSLGRSCGGAACRTPHAASTPFAPPQTMAARLSSQSGCRCLSSSQSKGHRC